MRIKEVRVFAKDLGTSRPYSISYKTVTEVKNTFVEIELENGTTGIGACNPSEKVVGENVDQALEHLQQADFDYLIGADIRSIQGLLKQTQSKFGDRPGSHAAVDIALHDVFTKHLGISLGEYFGVVHTSMPTSITIGIKNVEETLKEADEYRQMGFRCLKVKTGLSAEEDAERILKINEKYPDSVLRVDANQGYKPADLELFVSKVQGVDLELIEQPFPVEQFADFSKGLASNVAQFLVADESCRDPKDALFLVKEVPNCPIFNIKLMKSGGLFAASQIASIAQHSGVELMWGCNDESIVSITAAMHLAFSYPHTKYIDLDGSLDLIEDLVEGGFLIEEGVMRPTGGPGLGVRRITN
ncbi:MAG: dipeptide epimerase [Balneolaceae bacterium]|nr:dipeptide epimerase [Balneolaceae bacterium]